MSDDGSGFGFLLGFIVGMAGTLMMIVSLKISMKRGFKEYLFFLNPESRKEIDDRLESIYELTKELAIKSNTRLVKTLHNDFVSLRAYLLTMWKQN